MARNPVSDVEVDEWCSRFSVDFVDRAILRDAVALHRLTWWGPRLGMGEWDIWIADDCRQWERYLTLHEGVENLLRRRGWRYNESHKAAEAAERRAFGHEPEWHWYMKNV